MIKVHYFYNVSKFYKDSPSSNCSLRVDRIILYCTILYYTCNCNSFDWELHFPSSSHVEEHVNSGHVEETKECGSSEETSSAQNVYDIGHVIDEKSKNVTDH